MNQNKMGEFIEKLRKEKGLTQLQLAEKLGVSNSAISKWEGGHNLPDISMLEPLSDVLGVDMMDLLSMKSGDAKDLKRKASRKARIIIRQRILLIILSILFIIGTATTICSTYYLKKNIKLSTELTRNEIKVYEITSEDENFNINGYFIFNEKNNIIVINKISYQDTNSGINSNMKIENINLQFLLNSKIIHIHAEDNKNNYNLDEILESININAYEFNNNDINFKEINGEKLQGKLEISIYDKEEQVHSYDVKLIFHKMFID